MPRGLGDDPLSRQRRGRAAAAQRLTNGAMIADGHSSAQAVVQAEPAVEVSASSSQSRSYNDIFFQRRSDGEGGAEVNTPDAIVEPSVTGVVPIAVDVPAPVVQIEIPLPQPDETQAVMEPVAVIETQPERPAEAQPIEPEAKAVQPEAPKGGFFQRVFGRLRKP